MGNYIAAKPLIEKGAAIRRKNRGEKSSSYASSINNLALLNENFGNYTEAVSLYTEAMNIFV